ncbi:MAG TPA: hypothetical protein VEF76_07225 [Patescibacteria group bacterium]|nr:hypothetical protein [Patescibacteria group bacterium]
MASKTKSLPFLPALMARAQEFFSRLAGWLDAVLAPLEAEWTAAPALVPARISETRTRRITTARLYKRRRLSARAVLMMAHPVNHAHKWAARVAKRRALAAPALPVPASTIRFPQPPASRRLESALPAASGYAPGDALDFAQGGRADLFFRLRAGTGARQLLARQKLRQPELRTQALRPPVSRHPAAAFTPRPMIA